MSRPESGAGGGFPSEWSDYGDSTSPTWHTWDVPGRAPRAREPRDASGEAPLDRGGYGSVPEYNPNDRVSARDDVTGALGGVRVPANTRGRVVSTREGLFKTYVTVEFENGYTEEISAGSIKRLGWLD